MQHLDPDAVGLAALNESLDRWSREHLATCRDCSADVNELRSIVAMAKADGSAAVLERPGPAVWMAIKAELGLPAELGDDASARDSRRDASVSPLVPLEGGHRRTGRPVAVRWLAVAAGIGVVVGGGALWGFQSLGGTGGGAVLARAALEPLPGRSGSGEVTISRTGDGTRSLDIDLAGAVPEGYRQVWLIAPDLEQMYSVGLMDGDHGRFTVPAAIDLAQFPIVDVSDEPFDGDPSHSSVSMVRGTIQGS
ncbi:anti-sigma factor domain-containing protein [Arthrobacter sp. NPDC092385]|uniref:anti-sigma factor domain-containing protein n=1 Tax=Arthrobacter sp. NPDC092385 TaxID=3363943 RepID=UPI003822E1B6